MGGKLADEFYHKQMHFHQCLQSSYPLHEQVLEVVDSNKYLGVTLSEGLSWTNIHVS